MKLYVATPMYGGMCTAGYHISMLNLAKAMSFDSGVLGNEAEIGRARNILADLFLKSDCTHLMFIDSDIMFTPNDVKKLIAANKDVIGAWYPMKKLPLEYVVNGWNKDTNEVDKLGTGFLLIKRGVLIKMQSPQNLYIADQPTNFGEKMYAYFSSSVFNNRYLTEDFMFCEHWKDIGGKIYVDPTIKLQHIGSFVYG